nr:hypothetical protein [Dendronalium sp. ChiSLP03b]
MQYIAPLNFILAKNKKTSSVTTDPNLTCLANPTENYLTPQINLELAAVASLLILQLLK